MKNKEFYLIDAKNVTKGIDFIKEDNIIKFTLENVYVIHLIVMDFQVMPK